MPIGVYILALAVFAQGTSEFMLAGLLPAIAADLHVSISAAGLLTSAFAAGMVVGAPLMVVLARRWPRRRALPAFLAVFAAAHVLGAVAPGYGPLLAGRVVAALACAGFWAVAMTAAADLAGPAARGRATATLVGGVSLACVAGVPAGALLGDHLGWRAAFWAVAAVCAPCLAVLGAAVPRGRGEPDGRAAAAELRSLAGRRLVATLVMNALFQAATFATFTYLAPLAIRVAGLGAGWVPGLLVLFGAGAAAGSTLGGPLADARPVALVRYGMAALVLGWAVLALTAGWPVALAVLVFTQGLLAFGVGPGLIARFLRLATGAPTLAAAFATAAFNVGNTAGPWLAGLAIDAGLGYRSPAWVSAGLMVVALAMALTLTARQPARPVSAEAVRRG